MSRNVQYPQHLARLVSERLRAEHGESPPEVVLTRLVETLYFASLKTDEGRPILCTVNYVDPGRHDVAGPPHSPADRWLHIPFERPLPFDARTLSKVAKAADPAVSSLVVFADRAHKLFIWGMVDQELRYSDYIALDAGSTPQRPGLFQATITGVGNISVYVNYTLVASLEQDVLVQEYHDVLWSGPVHQILKGQLRGHLSNDCGPAAQAAPEEPIPDPAHVESELLVRWLNSLCRILMKIQRYRHGGGLLIVPHESLDGLNVKYKITYARLPRALLDLVQSDLQRGRIEFEINEECRGSGPDWYAGAWGYDWKAFRKKLDEQKNEVVGCAHFIASLSCVDGFVVLDKNMSVQGFGVEVRSDSEVSEVFIAGDSGANPVLLRKAELSQYGTRHRAMMRYCHANPGALGLVVSQDGDVRAMTRVGDKLILWENIEVQLAFRAENGFLAAEPRAVERCDSISAA